MQRSTSEITNEHLASCFVLEQRTVFWWMTWSAQACNALCSLRLAHALVAQCSPHGEVDFLARCSSTGSDAQCVNSKWSGRRILTNLSIQLSQSTCLFPLGSYMLNCPSTQRANWLELVACHPISLVSMMCVWIGTFKWYHVCTMLPQIAKEHRLLGAFIIL